MNTVKCRSDSMFAERPLSLIWEERHHEIAEIVARWRGPGERGFRVKTTDGQAFDLTYRELPDEWLIQPIYMSLRVALTATRSSLLATKRLLLEDSQ